MTLARQLVFLTIEFLLLQQKRQARGAEILLAAAHRELLEHKTPILFGGNTHTE